VGVWRAPTPRRTRREANEFPSMRRPVLSSEPPRRFGRQGSTPAHASIRTLGGPALRPGARWGPSEPGCCDLYDDVVMRLGIRRSHPDSRWGVMLGAEPCGLSGGSPTRRGSFGWGRRLRPSSRGRGATRPVSWPRRSPPFASRPCRLDSRCARRSA